MSFRVILCRFQEKRSPKSFPGIDLWQEVMILKQAGKWYVFCLGVLLAGLAAAAAGSRAVTAMADREVRGQIVVIDAGHGGEDGGAVSCTGRPESEYNLAIALGLRDLLTLLGRETRMIRTDDRSVYTQGQTLAQKKRSDLRHRAEIIESTPSALLVSIHQNQFPDSSCQGPQVFYPDTPGSKELAGSLQWLLNEKLGTVRQEKEASGIYLLEHVSCPGVLIECGFLSNPTEEAALRDPAYQIKLCSILAGAICQMDANT